LSFRSPPLSPAEFAHAQVDETLLSTPAQVFGGPQVVIGGIEAKIKNGSLVDEASLSFALAAIRRMISLSRRSSQSQFA
jgi:chromate reductase